ncbi:hypothetical protein Riv7116_4480 [Rivularia sp. PCC 7116]|uniref:hypothetical protein n=1 Tax=Rivularia sp. PCC 7116 TaxID=373994 RepID=UPI00029EFE6C|nr:hypothetical protein [Rivularia sp. PCC 7116]AFY56901.1 hypothetical protein Riv7116_4480 [Rivularia sp. PCC 7116]
MHKNNIRNNTANLLSYFCLSINLTISLLITTISWQKPVFGTIHQEDYLSEVSSISDSSAKISSSYNLKNYSELTKAEKQRLLQPVRLSSKLLTGKEEAPSVADKLRAYKKQFTQKIAQTDSSEVIGDTLGEANRLRQELLIDPIAVDGVSFGGAPGSTAGTPSAYGASWGQAYIGGGLFFPLEDGRTDGSLSVGFGLGDAVKSVGVEVNANITSVGGGDSDFDFGDSGTLGVKVHKYLGDGAAVAVGYSNPVTWGDSNNAKDTIYGVVTKSFDLQPNDPDNTMPLTVSVGVGSGTFRSKGALRAGDNSANVFGSIGIRTAPEVAWVSSWTGNRLNIGGSFAPLKQTPIVINAIFTDVTDNLDDGIGISLSAGYAIKF